MVIFEFNRGSVGGRMTVAVAADHVVATKGRSTKRIDFACLDRVHWTTIASPHREDRELVLVTPEDRAIIHSNSLAGHLHSTEFRRAVGSVLAAISQARPHIKVQTRPTGASAWAPFVCFLSTAIFCVGFGAIFMGESGTIEFVMWAYLMGALSAIFAWLSRPWQKGETLDPGNLAKSLTGESAG